MIIIIRKYSPPPGWIKSKPPEIKRTACALFLPSSSVFIKFSFSLDYDYDFVHDDDDDNDHHHHHLDG